MITINEIKDTKKYLVDEHHNIRTANQRRMQEFYDDTFPVSVIKNPQYLSRTGTSAWLVDGPAGHIITRNPQVFVQPKAENDKARDSAYKVNAMLNFWIKRLLKQAPQPIREFVKNLFLRGEGWIHVCANEDYNEEYPEYLPIIFDIPDPLNIFGSPGEKYGVPQCVVVSYETSERFVKSRYPKWVNPTNNKKISWMEYIDSDVRYFEAEGVPVFDDGIQENIYHFNPYIHAYSGFGKSSPEGKPETQAVGRLDKVTDLLLQECAINSDIDSCLHKFAHERIDLIVPSESAEGLNEKAIKDNYDMGAGALNVLSLPTGSRFEEGKRILPSQEAFQHFNNIRARISLEAPPIMSGLPGGTSGRQEDIVGYHFIRRFDCIVENTEDAFAKAFEMGRKILKVIPSWLPMNQWLEEPEGRKNEVKVTKEDLDNCTECVIKLKAADPIEDDRRLQAGRFLVESGRIDWETFLVDYVGMTNEQAQKIIAKTIAERVVQESLLPFIGRKALEKLGMAEELAALDAQTQLQTQMGEAMKKKSTLTGPQGGEPRIGNVQSPQAMEMADMMMTQRGVRSPAGSRQ